MTPRGWKWLGGLMVVLAVALFAGGVAAAIGGLVFISTGILAPIGFGLLAVAIGGGVLGVGLFGGGLFAIRHGRRRPKRGKGGAHAERWVPA